MSDESPWINGYPWMRLDEVHFPMKTVVDVKLTSEELKNHDNEWLLNTEWTKTKSMITASVILM